MRRHWRNMRRLAEIVGIILLGGCAGAQNHDAELAAVTRASLCKIAIDQHIAHAETCPEAQLAIDADPACGEFGHLDLHCKEFHK